MTEPEVAKVLLALDNLDQVILGIKAKGGYCYREKVEVSDNDLNAFIERSDKMLQQTVISLIIAEDMIAYSGRSTYYQKRVREAMAEIERLKKRDGNAFRNRMYPTRVRA
jgi:hypothetical protein